MLTTRLPLTVTIPGLIIVAFCLVLAGCGGGGGGGEKVNVTGFVFDDSSLGAVSGATAQIGNIKSQPSDVTGSFTLANIEVGQRELTVYRTGYQTVRHTVTIATNPTSVGNVFLPAVTNPGLGHISGVVKEIEVPVAQATVVAGGKIARTKQDGTFTIYNLQPGPTSVTAQLGQKLGRTHVTVMADRTESVNLGLSISPPVGPVL